MKVAVLIPDRGDRPEFLANCLRMMKAQTLQPQIILTINEPPASDQVDITYRYRIGYEALRNSGVDLIAFIENDDWYHAEYLETMANAWNKNGKPDIIGTCYTIYYHLLRKQKHKMIHYQRSSAMNTLIIPDMEFQWCKDSDPYTDMWLWTRLGLNKLIIDPGKVLSLGMKHGIGLCGGEFHNNRFHRYDDTDPGYLENLLDAESFKFYSKFGEQNLGK